MARTSGCFLVAGPLYSRRRRLFRFLPILFEQGYRSGNRLRAWGGSAEPRTLYRHTHLRKRDDRHALSDHSPLDMVGSDTPRIVQADRLDEGLVIQFENGQCAFYSGAYLFSKLPECEELNEADTEW